MLGLSLDHRLLLFWDQPPSCSAQGCTQIPEGAWSCCLPEKVLGAKMDSKMLKGESLGLGVDAGLYKVLVLPTCS